MRRGGRQLLLLSDRLHPADLGRGQGARRGDCHPTNHQETYLIFHFLQVVEELLKHPKTDVNKPDKNGYSALIWAADLNQPDIVKILLKHPAIEVKCEM